MSLIDKLQRAWNLFSNRDPTDYGYRMDYGSASYYRPDRVRLTPSNERTIIAAITNRIATDVAQIEIRHVKLDNMGRYSEDVNSDLNNCLTTEANKDQSGRAFRQDIAMSLIDQGCVAIVPVDTDDDIYKQDSFGIITLRVGKIIEWFPDNIRVELYNDRTGQREQKIVPKSNVAIVENPFYAIMNEPNSTLRRLTQKLSMLDSVDELTSSGKLDLIIQLPYVVKTAAQRHEADKRRKEIERQLNDATYGIAYTDGTEHITQLNRPAENNLMAQVQYLTDMLFSQLGITQSILDGTADEQTLNNYYDRTIEPIVAAITDEMRRKFLTKTARSQGHSIMFFRDPFKLIPASKIAEIADKFTRNEILSSNEVRGIVGYKPVNDPAADELRNANLNQQKDTEYASVPRTDTGGEIIDKEE